MCGAWCSTEPHKRALARRAAPSRAMPCQSGTGAPHRIIAYMRFSKKKRTITNYNSKKWVRWRVKSIVICETNYNSPSSKMPFPPIWEVPFQPRCRALWRRRLVLRTWEGGTWDCDGLAFIAQSQTGPWESQWEHSVREWWQGYNSQVWIKLGMEKGRQYIMSGIKSKLLRAMYILLQSCFSLQWETITLWPSKSHNIPTLI